MISPGDWCVLDTYLPFSWNSASDCEQIIVTIQRPADSGLGDLIARGAAQRFDGKTGSVSSYLWKRRVVQCAAALKNPQEMHRSITDIALSWGFSSSSHFSRVFRSTLGVSPRSYRAGSTR